MRTNVAPPSARVTKMGLVQPAEGQKAPLSTPQTPDNALSHHD